MNDLLLAKFTVKSLLALSRLILAGDSENVTWTYENDKAVKGGFDGFIHLLAAVIVKS